MGIAERLVAYRGKVAALVAASPGGLGGLRGMVHVRAFSGIGVQVVPGDVAIGGAFSEDSRLKQEHQDSMLEATVLTLVQTAKALTA